MSGLLGLFPAAPPAIATNPLPTTPRTDGERFELEFESNRLNGRFISRDTAMFEAFEASRDAYRQAGVDLENPYAGYWWRPMQILAPNGAGLAIDDVQRQRRLEAWTAAQERLARERPDDAARFLSVDQIGEQARQRARSAAELAERAAQVGGGWLGGFAGGAAAVFTDPVQLMTLPFGAPWRTAGSFGLRVLETAIAEALIAGGTQAVVETGAAPWRAEAGSPGSVGQNIGMAAAGGAVLGGGLRALVEGLGVVAGRAAARPGSVLEEAQDVALAGRAQLQSDLGNAAGPEGAAAHERAFDAAGQAVQQRRIAPASVPAPEQRQLAPWIYTPTPDHVDEAALRFVHEAWSGSPPRSIRGISAGFLDEAEAARIRERAGLPVGQETARILDSDRARHVLQRHGPGFEENPRQIPITAEDLANWHHLVRQAEETVQTVTDQGKPAAAHLVRLDDGSAVLIEEFQARRNVLALETMYRFRPDRAPENLRAVPGMAERIRRAEKGSPAVDARQRAGAPHLTSETTGGLGRELPPTAGRFNTFTPTGRPVLVEPQLMELDSLIPSHMDDGRPNPAFPHAEGVQPRDRSAAPSRDQVRSIAAQLAPARLAPNVEAGHGAPIVAIDNVVESGNGRVLALREVYANPDLAQHADAYRAFLNAQGHDTTGFQRPVLVSRRISALSAEERRAFVQEANSRGTLASSASERALQDGDRLRRALPLWKGGEVDSVGNAPFVRRFLEQLTEAERGDLLTREGHLTAEGIRRINDAMMAAAYGDVLGPLLRRFLETRNDGLRSVANALGDVAGDWARMRVAAERGEISAAVDATADLGNALAMLDHARRAKVAVRDLLVQADLDRPPLTDAGAAFLSAMFRDPGFAGPQLGRERIAARLQGYIDEAMKTQGGPSLFGDAARPSDVMAVGTRNADRQAAEAAPAAAAADQPALMAMDEAPPAFRFDAQPIAPPPLDPALVRRQQILDASRAAEAERAAAPPPAVKSAEVLEAQRIAAREDIPVPNPPDGQVPVEGAPTIGARELLDQAEDRVTQATQAAACLIGGMTT